jgi:hypothetical protein
MKAKGTSRRVTRPMTSRLYASDCSSEASVRCMNGQLYREMAPLLNRKPITTNKTANQKTQTKNQQPKTKNLKPTRLVQ